MRLARSDDQFIQPWSQSELTSYIRFQLSQLRAQNGHHAFEDICRDFARQNILANILPATGPVAAGGDQGRDFETFKTYLKNTLGPFGSFIGVAADETVVFACSLQVDNVKSKVMSDLSTICGEGTSVDRVFFFTESDVATAKRHDIIKAAREKYSVALEIIDGAGFAENLSRDSNTWIAVQHLSVPTSFLPEKMDAPDWYRREKMLTQESVDHPSSYGDLLTLRNCIRYATQEENFRSDIEFWVTSISSFLGADHPLEMQDIASYEIAVARLRGLGDMRPADHLAADFLERALTHTSPAQLEDATVLLIYVQGAWLHRTTTLGKKWIVEYGKRICRHVESLLKACEEPGAICELLDIKATLLGGFDIEAAPDDILSDRSLGPVPPMSDSRLAELVRRGDAAVRTDLKAIDAQGAVDCWIDLLNRIERAPLFPVRQLTESVAVRAASLVKTTGWLALTQGLDQVVEQQSGRAARAESAWRRAKSLIDADLPLEALNDLDVARKNWLTGDDFDYSIGVMFATAQAFQDIGLLYAAKHYFLAAGAIASARNVMHSSVPASLLAASYCDFLGGNWHSFVTLAGRAVNIHSEIRGSARDTDRWGDFRAVVEAVAYVQSISQVINSSSIDRFLEASFGQEFLVHPPEKTGTSDSSLREGEQYFRDQLNSDLGQQAFADCGAKRFLTWKMHGVSWRVRCKNKRIDAMAAERFAAATQELFTLFFNTDLVLCPSTVLIDLSTVSSVNGKAAHMEPRRLRNTAAGERHWSVKVTRDEGPNTLDFLDAHVEAATIILSILGELSLLREEKLRKEIENALRPSLLERIMPHIRFDRAISFIEDEAFNASSRNEIAPWGIPGSSEPLLHHSLREVTSPGPGYSRKESEIRCRNRYEAFERMLRYTLPALNSTASFQHAVACLRADGWKDWHILQALANQVLNYRREFTHESAGQLTPEIAFATEDADVVPIPPDAVTGESLHTSLAYSLGATLKIWGLDPHGEFSPEEYMAVMSKRYGYWSDDVPHRDPFLI